jgi:hypothetical protein
MCHSWKRQAIEQSFVTALHPGHRGEASRCDLEVTPRPPASLGKGIPEPGSQKALVLEPIEGRVKRAGRGPAVRALRDFLANAHAVCGVAKPHDGEQDDLFELSK